LDQPIKIKTYLFNKIIAIKMYVSSGGVKSTYIWGMKVI